jgi:hypothetical protein
MFAATRGTSGVILALVLTAGIQGFLGCGSGVHRDLAQYDSLGPYQDDPTNPR